MILPHNYYSLATIFKQRLFSIHVYSIITNTLGIQSCLLPDSGMLSNQSILSPSYVSVGVAPIYLVLLHLILIYRDISTFLYIIMP